MDLEIKVYNEKREYVKTEIYKNLKEIVDEFKIISKDVEDKEDLTYYCEGLDKKMYYIRFF